MFMYGFMDSCMGVCMGACVYVLMHICIHVLTRFGVRHGICLHIWYTHTSLHAAECHGMHMNCLEMNAKVHES